jgi:hypothetical protein
VLVENFTWDWIYAGYRERAPELEDYGARYAGLVQAADHHIQCRPACSEAARAVSVKPVSREPLNGRDATRLALGLDADDERPLLLLTMGGFGWGRQVSGSDDRFVYVTLGGVDELSRDGNLIRLPNRSPIYPPDLIWAADATICKLGYSTISECLRAGTRLGFVTRPGFPESPVLERFVRANLPAIELDLGGPSSHQELSDRLTASVGEILVLPRGDGRVENGADEVAGYLQALID